MTLAIRIGASAAEYSNINAAYTMAIAAKQKLSISGTGQEIKDALTTADASGKVLNDYANGIGSIKASSDIILNADQVTASKSVLLKLGTRSLVLQASGGTEDGSKVSQNFQALDATYTKFKAMNIADTPAIAVADLQASVNLAGMEKLSGRVFNVTGSAADIATSMTSLLRNVNSIGKLTIAGGTEAQFGLSQLQILGDKIDKGTNALTINATVGLGIAANAIAATGGHGFVTGDKVTLVSTAGAPAAGTYTYYVNAADANHFKLFTTATDAAANTNAVTLTNSLLGSVTRQATVKLRDTADNILTTSGLATINKYNNTNINAGRNAGDAPIRVTTLDSVNIDNASINQLNYATALTTYNNISTAGQANRSVSNIVSVVGIKDTATNLVAGVDGTTYNAFNSVTDSTKTLTVAANKYKTGDAVLYELDTTGGATGIGGLTSGTTYYVGKAAPTTIKLFDTRANAFAWDADNTSTVGLKSITAAVTSSSIETGRSKLSTSNLDQAMSAAARFKSNTGNVERVTIAGTGAITAATINSIATKALSGNPSANVAYSAKAVDMQSNISAIYDNVSSTVAGTKKLTELIVSDGTLNSKKAITLSMDQYSQLYTKFSGGVTNPLNNANAPTNYAFNVTGASYADSKKAGDTSGTLGFALQDDKNVASFYITNVAKASIDTLSELRDLLSQSKLKTVTTESQSANNWLVSEKTNLTTLYTQIGSNVDRAKLKITV